MLLVAISSSYFIIVFKIELDRWVVKCGHGISLGFTTAKCQRALLQFAS